MKSAFSSLLFFSRKWFGQQKNSGIGDVEVLFIRHDHDCGYEYHGKLYSPLIDSVVYFAKKMGLKTVSVAKPFSAYYGIRAQNNPLCFNRSFFLRRLIFKISSFFVNDKLAKKLNQALRESFWRKILVSIKPIVVIGVQPDPYLCIVAKSLGVKVYDLQHGVISEDHQWYGNDLRYNVSAEESPDGILCWDQATVNWLLSWAPKHGIYPILIGHPWFDRFMMPSKNDRLVKETIETNSSVMSNKPTVLVSLQWGLCEHHYKSSGFNGLICEPLIKVIKKTSGNINWLLRLHPVQLKVKNKEKVYSQLKNIFYGKEGVEWDSSSHAPLPLLLKVANIHITDMSSVVIEAASLGVPSAILSPHVRKGGKLENLYHEQRMKGLADIVKQDESEISRWVLSRLQLSKDINYICNKDGLNNFLKSIKGSRMYEEIDQNP